MLLKYTAISIRATSRPLNQVSFSLSLLQSCVRDTLPRPALHYWANEHELGSPQQEGNNSTMKPLIRDLMKYRNLKLQLRRAVQPTANHGLPWPLCTPPACFYQTRLLYHHCVLQQPLSVCFLFLKLLNLQHNRLIFL